MNDNLHKPLIVLLDGLSLLVEPLDVDGQLARGSANHISSILYLDLYGLVFDAESGRLFMGYKSMRGCRLVMSRLAVALLAACLTITTHHERLS